MTGDEVPGVAALDQQAAYQLVGITGSVNADAREAA